MEEIPQDRCERLAEGLSGRVAGEVYADPVRRALYSTDASAYQIRPAVVVLPRSADDVSAAVAFAAAEKLFIGPRGAGSGLAGECLTPGMVLDFTTHMNRVLAVDAERSSAVAEAGCVFEELNNQLAPTGKLFGPDPASGNRATIGGMVGNNSTGAHSLVYGHTSDHVRRIEAVLADGSRATFHADGRLEGDSPLAGRIRREIPPLLAEWADRIEACWPKAPRNRAGYALKGTLRDGQVNWAKLLCGSEGTLAVYTSVELGLLDVPAHKTIVRVNFDSLEAMSHALAPIVAAGASTCELMDSEIVRLARQAYPQDAAVLPDVPAFLIIEVDGRDEAEFAAKLDRMLATVGAQEGLVGEPKVLDDPADRARLMSARTKAVPLLFRRRDGTKPIPVIEDVTLPVERMPAYLDGLRAIAADERVVLAYYAHAGDGELHIRPYLNLYENEDRRRLQRLARRTFELAWGLDGSISGEHACGLARSGYLARQFGQVYELFGLVKDIFDPAGLLNPDRVVTDVPGEDLLVRDLRADYALPARAPGTILHFDGDEFVVEPDHCNGCGVCRGMESAARMCPAFRATRLEIATPRGKANLLRNLASGYLAPGEVGDEDVRALTDFCLGCQMCALECPSAVNVAKLMAEVKARLARDLGLRRAEAVLSRGESMGRFGSLFGAVANVALRVPGARWVMEKLTGVDRRRPMPPFAFRSSLGKLRRHARRVAPANPAERVAYFVDLFGTYHDHALPIAVVDVLAHNGVEVVVPDQKSAAMPMLAYGDVQAARR
ncbi:MAG TPA: FAD-linked oxidase C-terminal domain-containing protein, partial [Phycisphaerae bacterium]|nr:FAD-linked oxidase C-terminal domain-containing protein [Phycisphaerae bacterium]